MSDYSNRRYITFNISEKGDINYSEVYETSQESLRLSTDTSSSFVKYDLPEPASVSSLTSKSEEYNYTQFTALLITPAWSGSVSPIP
jgi:hypothetical protein|tara:strand:+ start:1211 stop:1471 length:261 start_codon:yes stop_codon:yes gene_type:complete